MVPWKIATNCWQLVVYPMFIHSHLSDSLQHIQCMYLPVIQATQNAKVQGFLWTSLLCWDRHIWCRTPSINLEPLRELLKGCLLQVNCLGLIWVKLTVTNLFVDQWGTPFCAIHPESSGMRCVWMGCVWNQRYPKSWFIMMKKVMFPYESYFLSMFPSKWT